ncbi:MAG: putative coat protein [Firnpuvirus faecenecus]|uniref:Coat protein n=1 Tax=Leviviridae sp. TaxID=2027243 RepID=A0ABY3ST15_9VIRU|nr:MAG: putative coat protein [Leviviridae sp.]
MPQLQQLVLTDRETTPVNHTFVPMNIIQPNNVGVLAEITGTPIGEPGFTISNRRSGGKVRGRVTITVPVVQTQTINGVSTPVVVRRAIADVNLTFDETSTTQERKNLLGFLYSAFATGKVLVEDAFVKAEGIY